MTIDLMEWNCSYGEFYDWIRNSGADVWASSYSATAYNISDIDFLAFKLKFKVEEIRTTLDFFDNGHPDANYF